MQMFRYMQEFRAEVNDKFDSEIGRLDKRLNEKTVWQCKNRNNRAAEFAAWLRQQHQDRRRRGRRRNFSLF